MDSIVPQLLLCWVVIFTVINLTFGLSQKIRNAGIVDVLWGFSFCAVTIFFTLTGDGDETRRIFLAVATSLWSGRLGIYLLMRWKALHPIEDKRYAELRQKWGTNANLYMFGMFHWQGALIMIFSPIFAVPTWNSNTGMSLIDWPVRILEVLPPSKLLFPMDCLDGFLPVCSRLRRMVDFLLTAVDAIPVGKGLWHTCQRKAQP